jgi:glycosyltransferase involved in cell wall biosynthesis
VPPRVLVVSTEPVGARMAGPAIRARELARALAAGCDVTLAAPAPSADPDVRVLEAGPADYRALVAAIERHDVVVAQQLPPRLLARVWRGPTRIVADLSTPTVLELLERPVEARARQRGVARRAAAAHLAAADLVLCASERQRDLWLGGMALGGDLEAAAPIAVVPFGVSAQPPAPGPGLRAALPAVGPRVLLWAGGVWDWLDAPTVIQAVALLPDDVHLVFLGVRRPALLPRDEHAATRIALELAGELGLLGRRVHVHDGWVPYAERGAWLLQADVGVSAHPDHLEARFAYRTRLLDHLWAGLPSVVTGGDALGDEIAARWAGRAVPAGDPAAFAAACAALLADPDAARAAARTMAAERTWDQVAAPLRAFCADGAKRSATPARARAIRSATLGQYSRIAAETLRTDGPWPLAHKLGRNLARVARRA